MKKVLLIIALILTGLTNVKASHIPGGNFTWTCTGNPNEYLITMTMFVSCPSSLSTTSYTGTISNSCGLVNPVLNLPLVPSTPTNPNPLDVSQICWQDTAQSDCAGNGGGIVGVNMYTYQALVTLPGPCDFWDFSFDLCCRDQNSNTAGGTGNNMYFNSQMNSATAPCDASPYVTAQPIPYMCAGVTQTYCPGAIDPDGDSLVYVLVNPMDGGGTPIAYNLPYTVAAPLQNLVLDPTTGCITFNQPTTGNFVVAYRIEAYDNAGNMTGFITHDFQIEIITSANCQPPTPPPTGVTNPTGTAVLLNGNTIEICEGGTFCFDVTFTDPDLTDTLRIDSGNTNIWASMPGVIVTLNYPNAPANYNEMTVNVCWTVPPGANSNTSATIGVTDGSCPIENLASFPVNINVINSTVVNAPIILCGNQTAQMTAAGGSVFTWFYTATGTQIPVGPEFSCNPCANPIATPVAFGTTSYYVMSNLNGGCNASDTTTVTRVPDFTPTAYGDTLLCDYYTTPIGVTNTPAGAYTALWSPAASLNNATILTPDASPTQTTTYVVDVTSPMGCLKTDSMVVTVMPPPVLTLTPGDTVLCLGESLQFEVNSTCDYTLEMFDSFGDGWNNQSIEIWENGVLIGTYTVTNANNGGNWNTVTFPVINGSTITIVYNTGAFQSESSFNLIDGTGATQFTVAQGGMTGWVQGNTYFTGIANCGPTLNGYSFLWTPSAGLSNDTISNPIATPAVTTAYTVTLTAGVCSVNRTQTITVAPNFTTTLTQTAANTCLFDPVQLDVAVTPAGPGYTYQWTPATFLNSDVIANPLATITTPGTHQYFVTTTGPGGCMKIDSITIVISNNVAPTFTLTAADSLIWCGQSTQFTVVMDTLIVAGTIDDFNGAVVNPTSWSSVTNGSLNGDCGSVTGTALHFDGNTTPREAITTAQNVTSCSSVEFSLFIGNAGSGGAPCENADAGEDVEFSYSTAGPGGPWTLIQMYDSDDWDAAGPYNNTWTPFSVAIPVGAQTPATYFKWDQPTFSACAGCDNWALDDVSITCPAVTNNYSYAWVPANGSLNDDTLQNPLASPLVTTTYVITVTDPNGGCTSTDSVTVFVDCGTCLPAIPTLTDVSCKDGTDGQIIAAPIFTPTNAQQVITWFDNLGTLLQTSDTLYAGGTDTLVGIGAGTYTITVWDSIGGGCTMDTIVTITEPDSVMVNPTIANNIICIGGSTNIDATATDGNGAPYMFTWTNLNTGVVIPGNGPHNVSPTDTLTCYSVFATDPLGCISSTDSVCVNLFDSITAVPVIAGPITDTLNICPNEDGLLGMTATGGNGGPYTFEWWENGNLIGTNQFQTVTPTGSFTTYTGYAYDNCGSPRGTVTIYVNWYGLVIPSISVDQVNSCVPMHDVVFTNTSTPLSLVDTLLTTWSSTNGGTSSGTNSFVATFDVPVCQDVTLNMWTTEGCPVDTTFTGIVCPYGIPEANFYMTPPITTILNTEIHFTNLSTGNDLTYLWNFNSGLNPDSSTATHPIFNFPNAAPGTYPVLLTATSNPEGCVDTYTGTVIINGIYLFYVPNSFTPNGDGVNDLFFPSGEGIDMSQYTMQIFDRWGELIYSTSDASQGWDGTYKGKALETNTFVWKIVAKEEYSPIIHDNYGNVNLMK